MKMGVGLETLVWVDSSATFNPDAPTAASLVTALGGTPKAWNFTKAALPGYTLGVTASDKVSSRSVADKVTSEVRGATNYEGLVTFFREKDPTTNTSSVYLAAFNQFKKKGKSGWWVKRLGYAPTVAFAAGQRVTVLGFVAGQPRDGSSSDQNGPMEFTVPFYRTGKVKPNVALA